MSRNGSRPRTREVGTVLSITPTGRFTVRSASSDVVPEGTAVRDSRGLLHGKVVRVFGPVAQPYLSVRVRRTPTPAEGSALIGAPLLTEGKTEDG